MTAEAIRIDEASVRKLLGAASPDAALLYIYVFSGNLPANAEEALHISSSRMACAAATLRQLGLWPEERRSSIAPGERPAYTEQDVAKAMESDAGFRGVYEEIQRVLGRNLNTEDLKIVLGFINYLGLPAEVVCTLVYYCKDRARQRGSGRNPSLRTIEKEAYFWAENGIDSLEEAAIFVQNQNRRRSRLQHIMNLVQIRGRSLTQAEEKYAQGWLERGFDDELISMAYERTCLNTGGLNWAYMNKILERWAQQGLRTADAVASSDKKPGVKVKGAERQLDAEEQAAIAKMMQGG